MIKILAVFYVFALVANTDANVKQAKDDSPTEQEIDLKIERFFEEKAERSQEEIKDFLLQMYGETDLESVKPLDEKKERGEKLTEEEEEKVFLRNHVDEFINAKYPETVFNVDILKRIVKKAETLFYLEETMKLEEIRAFSEEGMFGDDLKEEMGKMKEYPELDGTKSFDQIDDLEQIDREVNDLSDRLEDELKDLEQEANIKMDIPDEIKEL